MSKDESTMYPRSMSPRRPWPPEGMGGMLAWPIAIFLLLVALPCFIWFFCRIEPRADEIAVLIHKTGQDLPSGQILAATPKQKGILLTVLPPGRYFRNPYSWGWKIEMMTDIPAGKLGVMTRLFGDDLLPGQILATGDNMKGIVEEPLKPGKYPINPYAYRVDINDAINIRPGCVGVLTCLSGKDIFNSELDAGERNTFLVKASLKGVLAEVKDPGTYYYNPYVYSLVEVNLQSQRFAVSGADSISFLTMDGFTVSVEGTVEFAIERARAADLTHRVGDMNDIVQKLVLPRMRGFCRIEGSKHPAVDFIVGETRQGFQNDLERHLRSTCESWGVAIKSVLIRNILPPDEIASIIRDREVAVQERNKYDQEVKQAKSKAKLVEEEMLAQRSREKVEAETVFSNALIIAEQDLRVKVVAAEKEKQVAGIEKEAAESQAKAILSIAQGNADVVRTQNVAEASVVRNQVKAFGNGANLARYNFYKKVGPQIDSILSTDQEQGLGSLFLPYLPHGKEVK